MVDIFAGKRYFTSPDLASGYWQIGVRKDSCDYTKFVTPGFHCYKFLVMSFGLTSSNFTFQRVMNTIFVDKIANGECLLYIDDLLVASRTFEEYLESLNVVFERLIAAGLKLKMSKAAFCKKELTYLGHKITESGQQRT